MSVVITRPPPLVTLQTKQKPQRVFTLHSSPNNVFAWTAPSKNMKTATVVFRREYDALLMAHMIESHVRQRQEWPSNDMKDFKLDTGPMKSSEELQLISVRSWDFELLKVFCVQAYLDMVTLTKLTPSDDGFRITGEMISLDVPAEVYAERLSQLWVLE